jgi:hypothetical protein
MIMKRVTGVLMKIGLAALVAGFVATISFAIEPIQKGPAVDPEKIQKPVPRPTTDLRVDKICGDPCFSFNNDYLRAVDALYMPEIIVYAGNFSPEGGGGVDPVNAILKVTYYDLKLGRLETKTRNLRLRLLTVSQPFGMVSEPVLMKKSVGIKAEIQPTGLEVDSNPSNNVKTVHECVSEFH